jgi:hypothetical protein
VLSQGPRGGKRTGVEDQEWLRDLLLRRGFGGNKSGRFRIVATNSRGSQMSHVRLRPAPPAIRMMAVRSNLGPVNRAGTSHIPIPTMVIANRMPMSTLRYSWSFISVPPSDLCPQSGSFDSVYYHNYTILSRGVHNVYFLV